MSIEARKIRMIMELRRLGISDLKVLSTIETVPRDYFVPETFQDKAYENMALPIGLGQTISQPYVVAKMTEELSLNDRLRVLEIGTGSGYQTIVLSKLCRRVYTIERHKHLMKKAEENFNNFRINNITTLYGDGWKGWPEQAPFDRIIVTAAPTEIPTCLLDQLKPEGILICPVGQYEQDLLKVIKNSDGTLSTINLGGVKFVPLVEGKN